MVTMNVKFFAADGSLIYECARQDDNPEALIKAAKRDFTNATGGEYAFAGEVRIEAVHISNQ